VAAMSWGPWLPLVAALPAMGVAVKVQFYGQAGCGHCYAFMTGALKQVLAQPELASQIDFDYSPFGNSYFVTSKCQGAGAYDIMPRKCFDSNCGLGTEDRRPADCFTGELVCQNGPRECEANRYVACAKKVVNADHTRYLPFAECVDAAFEGNPTANGVDVGALAAGCSQKAGLPHAAVQACFGGPDGNAAVQQEAMGTPPHGFCPVVKVDGEELQWGTEGNLQEVVCGKISPRPAACSPLVA